jgi:hypothetical protein
MIIKKFHHPQDTGKNGYFRRFFFQLQEFVDKYSTQNDFNLNEGRLRFSNPSTHTCDIMKLESSGWIIDEPDVSFTMTLNLTFTDEDLYKAFLLEVRN